MLDRDLQVIVNGLWAAGAEAIAVNGQRLTACSAIRSAGEAILVDFRPLSAAVRGRRRSATRHACGPVQLGRRRRRQYLVVGCPGLRRTS